MCRVESGLIVCARCRVQVTGCAAIGTFLVSLGVDLVLEKQSGMSFALRFLFDRNNSHFLVRIRLLPRFSRVVDCSAFRAGHRPPRLQPHAHDANRPRRVHGSHVRLSCSDTCVARVFTCFVLH